jgi:membrane-associated protease RseP (regulator of RpoE activity)
VLLCCVWLVSARAADKSSSYLAALDSIKADELGEYVGHLADPAMEGREAGTRGGHAAGEYLVEQYAKLHLSPAGNDGGYFQPFVPNFRNLLVILRGSDPELRDQVILVGAHYDHIGYGGRYSLGPTGYIHPGADDNASGTATVLELAKAFTILSPAPKRSILFVAWDAEEKGLLGSKHWVAHPTVPLDHLVAAVNLDMVGRLRDEHLTVMGSRTGYGWRRLTSLQNDESNLLLEFSWPMKPEADHYTFFDNGIPVLMLHTGMHGQYHRPTDTANLINTAGMAQLSRLLFGVVCNLADAAATPAYRAAARHETDADEKAADRLGIGWSEDAAVTGGVRVSAVAPDSPAQQAGLRVGDCIVQFAGRSILSDDDFFGAVCAADSPASVTFTRPGQEKPQEAVVALRGAALHWGIMWRVDDAEPGAVILTHVVPGSPAARAGLATGDRIYQVAGRDFADEAEFARLAKTVPLPLQLLVERDGRLRLTVLKSVQAEPARRAA